MEGCSSGVHKQATGIRQGCPFSPFFFLRITTAIFYEIKLDINLQDKLRPHRPLNADFDEILYPDDTFIFTRDPDALELYLKRICEAWEHQIKHQRKENKDAGHKW